MYNTGNIVNNTVITVCGDRSLLDLLWGSIHNKQKCIKIFIFLKYHLFPNLTDCQDHLGIFYQDLFLSTDCHCKSASLEVGVMAGGFAFFKCHHMILIHRVLEPLPNVECPMYNLSLKIWYWDKYLSSLKFVTFSSSL